MLGLELVRPLEESWRDALDEVARRRGWPTSRDVAALGARVAALSGAYNDPSVARAAAAEAGPARLGFSFVRDVPKGAAAVRELVAGGFLRFPGEGAALRVLDVGAGMGATTWGVLRALAAAARAARGDARDVPVAEATWVDADARALELGMEVVRARGDLDGVTLRVRSVARAVGGAKDVPIGAAGLYDAVLVGQVLSELDVGEAAEVRVQRHAELVASLLEHHVDPGGSLVVVEPALRDRTRHLHAVRDRVLADHAAGTSRLAASARLTVFAPCLHGSPCPALVRPGDWCHEDLPVDLPRWLVPVARSAGLRREGLTFSYLVLRKDGSGLADLVERVAASPQGTRWRVVSELMRTKGKREAFLCGKAGGESQDAVRMRAVRLDRERSPLNVAWDDAVRGDVLVVHPGAPPILAGTGVRVIPSKGQGPPEEP